VNAQAAFAASFAPGAPPHSLAEYVDVAGLPATPDFAGPLVVEVGGDLMAPTLHAGARVLATPVPGAEWPYMPSGVYCVVYRSTFVIKRVKDNHLVEQQLLLLHSDNHLGGTHPVRGEDIRAIWRVRWAVYAPVN
jgi:phage repressor protein C with HTH and peptisase S24 domain